DIYNARVSPEIVVKDISHNGSYKWPEEWIEKCPKLSQYQKISIDESKNDELVWRSKKGKEGKFTVKQTYEDLRSSDEEVEWCRSGIAMGVIYPELEWNDLVHMIAGLYIGNSIENIIRRLGLAGSVYLTESNEPERGLDGSDKGVCSLPSDAQSSWLLDSSSEDVATGCCLEVNVWEMVWKYSQEDMVLVHKRNSADVASWGVRVAVRLVRLEFFPITGRERAVHLLSEAFLVLGGIPVYTGYQKSWFVIAVMVTTVPACFKSMTVVISDRDSEHFYVGGRSRWSSSKPPGPANFQVVRQLRKPSNTGDGYKIRVISYVCGESEGSVMEKKMLEHAKHG
ncbi:hypothetical protein Tco_1353687, partial [Tanacetum coccineum]